MKPYKNIKVAGITYSEHRHVWERAYGRIPPGYVVHHINHEKRDNRLENLQLMTYEEHARHHNDRYARIKTCVVCETEFEPHPTKRARQQTCSWECRSELLSALAFARHGGPNVFSCERCGKVKPIPPGRVGKARYCSRTCSARRHQPLAAAAIGAATGLDWRSAVEREYAPAEYAAP